MSVFIALPRIAVASIRENAAVHGGSATKTPSSASLIPMAFVAVGVVVLALLVSGVLWRNTNGTIVVQRITLSFTTHVRDRTNHSRSISVITITETSAAGTEQRSFTSSSFTRPGFQQVAAGKTLQLYDPVDNTVYVTTEQAQQRATVEQMKASAPKGATVNVGVGKLQAVSANGVSYAPGGTSVYEQWLHDGSYKLVGRTTIDGAVALKLIQSNPTRLPVPSPSGRFASTTIVYVTPGSYDPIETVNRTKLPGVLAISATRWHTYRVLPATAANKRLLSLTARHPQARVVHNAMAFLRATQSAETPTRQPQAAAQIG
jgi:hypothetical protein